MALFKGRSTIDHISTSTSIIETRKKCKLSTFVSFIDVKKPYDIIDRYLLFNKLDNLDLSSKFMLALKAIYSNIECCVRLNGHTVTEQKFLPSTMFVPQKIYFWIGKYFM
jgi:hypothetical protein